MLMTDIPDIQTVFLSHEAARYLGISVQKLNRLRRQERIHGTQVGTSKLYTYTIKDLKEADLTERKRGPKRKK